MIKTLKRISILLIVLSIILEGTGIILSFSDSKKTSEKIIEKKVIVEEEKEQEYINILPEYRTNYNNDDIKAKLEIPSLEIDTLITQSTDNEFYLNNDINKQANFLGTPFLDFRNQDLENDKQINIYGHNTQVAKYFDDLPFKKLEQFKDETFFNNNKDVYLSTDKQKNHYKVIAVKIITNEDNEHMRLIYTDEFTFENHLEKLFENTLYKDINEIINEDTKLLVLQACNYEPIGSYILVISRKLK